MRPVGTIVFLSTAVAAAQTTRSFHLTQNETADQIFQIATLIRSTAGESSRSGRTTFSEPFL